jgi:acylphosphatase
MSATIARRCYVSGRVQGVFYRASTRERATSLGVRGHAINLPDGRVEVLAIGEPAAVHALIEWLAIGPPAARVANVEVLEVMMAELDEAPAGFGTR